MPLVVIDAALGLLSRYSQGQSFSGCRYCGGWLQMWNGIPRVSGAWWLGIVCRMCLSGLGSREQGSLTSDPATHLSRGSQGKALVVEMW